MGANSARRAGAGDHCAVIYIERARAHFNAHIAGRDFRAAVHIQRAGAGVINAEGVRFDYRAVVQVDSAVIRIGAVVVDGRLTAIPTCRINRAVYVERRVLKVVDEHGPFHSHSLLYHKTGIRGSLPCNNERIYRCVRRFDDAALAGHGIPDR